MKHKLAIIILVSTFFGLASGAVGAILARVYILEKALNLSFFGELNFDNNDLGSSLVIRNPRKVVVDQDLKVAETAASLKNSIASIHQKIKALPESGQTISLDNYYSEETALASGFILTSDGWLISSLVPAELAKFDKADLTQKEKAARAEVISGFTVVLADGQVEAVDDIIASADYAYAFYHISGIDLPVRRILGRDEYKTGESVFALDRRNWAFLTNVLGEERPQGLVRSSDEYASSLRLADELPAGFYGSFIFNFNGDLVALADAEGRVEPAANYNACLSCVLKNGSFSRPFLGLYYADLSELVPADAQAPKQLGALIIKNEKGVAVIPKSPADLAGLKEGDIITAVNGQAIAAAGDLARSISGYQPKDEIELAVLSGETKKSVKIVLSEK